MDPRYATLPIGVPTSALREGRPGSNWESAPAPGVASPPWGPDGQGMLPPPPGSMYVSPYYPPYYRPPGMPLPPHLSQINPELLAQSNGHPASVGPPESALRNTSAEKSSNPLGQDPATLAHPRGSVHATSSTREEGKPPPEPPSELTGPNGASTEANGTEAPDPSTLMAAVALQAVLAYQKEQEIREAAAHQNASLSTHPEPLVQRPPQSASEATAIKTEETQAQVVPVEQLPDPGPPVIPVEAPPQEEDDDEADAIGEPDSDMLEEGANTQVGGSSMPPPSSMDALITEDGMPMLNPGMYNSMSVSSLERWLT